MKKVFIIAEAGVNHNGDYKLALKLIDAAVEAKADAIKFQTFVPELIAAPTAEKADYQVTNTGEGSESQLDMIRKLSLTHEDFKALKDYCDEQGILFLSTTADIPSTDFITDLIPLFKVGSADVTNYPLLKHIASKKKPVIFSTGMATLKDIESALELFEKFGVSRDQITVLHCNTEYPTPMQDVNLLAMDQIKSELHVKVGYSDHTLGIEIPVAAVARGAQVIEKHFTLDRSMDGPDHAASLEPEELKKMVASIRNTELAISGKGIKEVSVSERKNIVIARKSIHLANDLKAGARITECDLVALRPGDGISTMEWEEIIGRKLTADCSKFHKLSYSDLQ